MPASHTALLYEVKTINKIQFTERPREGYFSEHFAVPTPRTDELTRCNRSGSSCSHGRWGCPLFWWVLKDLQVRKHIHNILSFSAFSLNSCQLPNAVPGTLRLFFKKASSCYHYYQLHNTLSSFLYLLNYTKLTWQLCNFFKVVNPDYNYLNFILLPELIIDGSILFFSQCSENYYVIKLLEICCGRGRESSLNSILFLYLFSNICIERRVREAQGKISKNKGHRVMRKDTGAQVVQGTCFCSFLFSFSSVIPLLLCPPYLALFSVSLHLK